MPKKNVQVEYAKFAVLDRPACVWNSPVAETGAKFLAGVDPLFFAYQSRVHASILAEAEQSGDTSTALRASLALRLAHGAALEFLFAMVGAVMQAPHCVFGWLNLYKNDELLELVARLRTKRGLKTLAPFRPPTIERVVAVVLSPLERHDAPEHARVAPLFVRALNILAEEFTNRTSTREYNSLKHSFRVQPAANLKFEMSHEDSVVFRSESSQAHAVPYLVKMSDHKLHYNVSNMVVALQPAYCSAALAVISCMLHDLVSYARAREGIRRSARPEVA